MIDEKTVQQAGMVDIVFDLSGESVPASYPFSLWGEISRILPWLNDEPGVGILPLRGSESGERLLLSRRSKLVLRVPESRAADTLPLSRQVLVVGASELRVGEGKQRPLQPSNTLHAWLVESGKDETSFLAEMRESLQAMNISSNLICDKYRNISDGKRALTGYGLVLHDLKPAASLVVQQRGLGGARQFGCGIFVPFKTITGLEAE